MQIIKQESKIIVSNEHILSTIEPTCFEYVLIYLEHSNTTLIVKPWSHVL